MRYFDSGKWIKTVQTYFKLCLVTTSLYKGAASRSLWSLGAKAASITHAGLFVRMRTTWAACMAWSSQGWRSQLTACLHQTTMGGWANLALQHGPSTCIKKGGMGVPISTLLKLVVCTCTVFSLAYRLAMQLLLEWGDIYLNLQQLQRQMHVIYRTGPRTIKKHGSWTGIPILFLSSSTDLCSEVMKKPLYEIRV